MSVTVICGKPI